MDPIVMMKKRGSVGGGCSSDDDSVSVTTAGPTNKRVRVDVDAALVCTEDIEADALIEEALATDTTYESIVPMSQILDWECSDDIMETMLIRQQQFVPHPNYMQQQNSIDAWMRALMLDWMFEVSWEFSLGRETAHLAIGYVDRYLSKVENLPRDTLQLLGCTCLMIAAKLEESHPPKVDDFSLTTGGAYTTNNIFIMEREVLRVLGWELLAHTPYSFVKLFTKLAAKYVHLMWIDNSNAGLLRQQRILKALLCTEAFHRRMELVDVCLMEIGHLNFLPSQIAVACIFYTIPELRPIGYEATGYSYEDIQECIGFVSHFSEVPPGPLLQYNRRCAYVKITPADMFTRQSHHKQIIQFYRSLLATRSTATYV